MSKEPNTSCNYCKKDFYIKPSKLERGRGKYCSRDCYYESMKIDNEFESLDDYAVLILDNGSETKRVKLDKEDLDKVKQKQWHFHANYVATTQTQKKYLYLHRWIMGVNEKSPEKQVDHINGDKFDNRKENLRLVTPRQQMRNCGDSRSENLGVRWDKQGEKWRVDIRTEKERKYIGSFESKEKALKARKEAEDKYHGEYGYHNSREIDRS